MHPSGTPADPPPPQRCMHVASCQGTGRGGGTGRATGLGPHTHTHTHTHDMQHLRLPTRAWRPHAMAATTTHKGRATEQRRKWVACRTRFIDVTTGVWCPWGGGLQPVLMRDLPQLSVKTCGGGGGGRREGGGGGGGGLHATHYHHMHTSRGCVCLGHGGMEVCMG